MAQHFYRTQLKIFLEEQNRKCSEDTRRKPLRYEKKIDEISREVISYCEDFQVYFPKEYMKPEYLCLTCKEHFLICDCIPICSFCNCIIEHCSCKTNKFLGAVQQIEKELFEKKKKLGHLEFDICSRCTESDCKCF